MCLNPTYCPDENQYEPCCECEACIGVWVEDVGQKPSFTFDEALVEREQSHVEDLPF
jgi:hypothetical protein